MKKLVRLRGPDEGFTNLYSFKPLRLPLSSLPPSLPFHHLPPFLPVERRKKKKGGERKRKRKGRNRRIRIIEGGQSNQTTHFSSEECISILYHSSVPTKHV